MAVDFHVETGRGRIVWVDAARGIAMLMIVASHLLRNGPVADYLGSSGVVLFFFLSGYIAGGTGGCDRHSKASSVRRREEASFGQSRKNAAKYWKKKFYHIYLPYLFVGLFSILVYAAGGKFAADSLGASAKDTDILHNLIYLLYANSKGGRMKWNETLWFLPCFLVVLLLASLIEKILAIYEIYDGGTQRQSRERIFLTVDCVLLGYLFSQVLHWELPWQAETAFTMMLFYEGGILWRQTQRGPGASGVYGNSDVRLSSPLILAVLSAAFLTASIILTIINDPGEDASSGTAYQTMLRKRLLSGISTRADVYPHFLLSLLILCLCTVAFCLLARLSVRAASVLHGHGERRFELQHGRQKNVSDRCSTQKNISEGCSTQRVGQGNVPDIQDRGFLASTGRQSLDIMLWNKFPVLAVQIALSAAGAAKLLTGNRSSAAGLLLALLPAILCEMLCLIWAKLLRTAASCITSVAEEVSLSGKHI